MNVERKTVLALISTANKMRLLGNQALAECSQLTDEVVNASSNGIVNFLMDTVPNELKFRWSGNPALRGWTNAKAEVVVYAGPTNVAVSLAHLKSAGLLGEVKNRFDVVEFELGTNEILATNTEGYQELARLELEGSTYLLLTNRPAITEHLNLPYILKRAMLLNGIAPQGTFETGWTVGRAATHTLFPAYEQELQANLNLYRPPTGTCWSLLSEGKVVGYIFDQLDARGDYKTIMEDDRQIISMHDDTLPPPFMVNAAKYGVTVPASSLHPASV